MNRRGALISLLAFGVSPLAVEAQQPATKLARIAYLGFGDPEISAALVNGFKQGMLNLGYIEGKNVAYEFRWALGKVDRLPEIAKEIVALKPDVILAPSLAATLVIQKATTTIPIVTATLSDPVGSGVVKSLARPGGNITGISTLAADLELIRK